MNGYLNWAAVTIAAALLMAACGSDDDEGLISTGGGIQLAAASGGTVSPDGTWVGACEDAGGNGQVVTAVISGPDLGLTFTEWPGDIACTGAGTPQMSIAAILSTLGEKTATWLGTPPNALPSTVTVTKFFQDVPNDPALSGNNIVMIDDTVASWQLFSDQGGMSGTLDAEGFPNELATSGLTKQ